MNNVEKYIRYSLAIVYIWFGVLKPFGISPAAGLVDLTLDWTLVPAVVSVLGIWEIVIGIGFLLPKYTRIVLAMFLVHMLGTFIPMFYLVDTTFTAAPYGLTIVGQYIIKNLVFLAAGNAIYTAWKSRQAA